MLKTNTICEFAKLVYGGVHKSVAATDAQLHRQADMDPDPYPVRVPSTLNTMRATTASETAGPSQLAIVLASLVGVS